MRFEEELESVLPADLPHRAAVIDLCARHLELILQTNSQFNLTRITNAREAAVKHVLDSVLPWKHFAQATAVLDAGTGAGFPGVPLALVLPEIHFTLTDSVGKKARFVESVVQALAIPNITVANARAEVVLRNGAPRTITGRALTPLENACTLFARSIRSGSNALFYKGPDAETEIDSALAAARKLRLRLRIVDRYDLPEGFGARTLVEVTAA